MKNENKYSPTCFVGFVCAAFVEVILLYLLIWQIIGFVQSLAHDAKLLIIYSLLYSVTALLLLLSMLGIAAIVFNYRPKNITNTRIYFIVIYLIAIVTILCIVAFYVYAIISNQQTLQSLTTENIIDENNVLPTFIAQVERNITMCWCNFGLSLFYLLPLGGVISTHQLRIKNGIDNNI